MVAFRLSAKAMKTNIDNILSIFSLPNKAPGRVYIEARGSTPVRLLCEGMHFVYVSSIFIVPIVERVALLQHGNTLPLIKRGDFVKIRNGLYKDDIGEVSDVSAGHDVLTVKLKGREAHPRELKRKRGDSNRRETSLLDKEELRRLQAFGDRIHFTDLGEDGFLFRDKWYTSDGYLLLSVRYDRVDRSQRPMNDFESLVSKDSQKISDKHAESTLSKGFLYTKPSLPITLSDCQARSFPVPKYIRSGDRVHVSGGASAGAQGRVVELTSPLYALVDLEGGANEKQAPVHLAIELASLFRIFDIGDHVEIKIGELKGRSGVVSFLEGEMLHIVNPQELSEVSTKLCNGHAHLTLCFSFRSQHRSSTPSIHLSLLTLR